MERNSISVIDAANELSVRKQYLFKIINRLGIQTAKKKSSSHKGQAISYITNADFDRIVNEVANSKPNNPTDNSTTQPDHGKFYLIQLEPEHDPGRFKLGFASNMRERLRSHRCSAPFAKVLKTWPCHSLWERTAIDSVTQGCKKIHNEIFRTTDIDSVRNRCDRFFDLMPALDDVMR